MMQGRFDYVKFDDESTIKMKVAKNFVMALEKNIEDLGPGRPQSLALTKLEECYMWIGKAIRDEQVKRGGSAKDVPERTNE